MGTVALQLVLNSLIAGLVLAVEYASRLGVKCENDQLRTAARQYPCGAGFRCLGLNHDTAAPDIFSLHFRGSLFMTCHGSRALRTATVIWPGRSRLLAVGPWAPGVDVRGEMEGAGCLPENPGKPTLSIGSCPNGHLHHPIVPPSLSLVGPKRSCLMSSPARTLTSC